MLGARTETDEQRRRRRHLIKAARIAEIAERISFKRRANVLDRTRVSTNEANYWHNKTELTINDIDCDTGAFNNFIDITKILAIPAGFRNTDSFKQSCDELRAKAQTLRSIINLYCKNIDELVPQITSIAGGRQLAARVTLNLQNHLNDAANAILFALNELYAVSEYCPNVTLDHNGRPLTFTPDIEEKGDHEETHREFLAHETRHNLTTLKMYHTDYTKLSPCYLHGLESQPKDEVEAARRATADINSQFRAYEVKADNEGANPQTKQQKTEGSTTELTGQPHTFIQRAKDRLSRSPQQTTTTLEHGDAAADGAGEHKESSAQGEGQQEQHSPSAYNWMGKRRGGARLSKNTLEQHNAQNTAQELEGSYTDEQKGFLNFRFEFRKRQRQAQLRKLRAVLGKKGRNGQPDISGAPKDIQLAVLCQVFEEIEKESMLYNRFGIHWRPSRLQRTVAKWFYAITNDLNAKEEVINLDIAIPEIRRYIEDKNKLITEYSGGVATTTDDRQKKNVFMLYQELDAYNHGFRRQGAHEAAASDNGMSVGTGMTDTPAVDETKVEEQKEAIIHHEEQHEIDVLAQCDYVKLLENFEQVSREETPNSVRLFKQNNRKLHLHPIIDLINKTIEAIYDDETLSAIFPDTTDKNKGQGNREFRITAHHSLKTYQNDNEEKIAEKRNRQRKLVLYSLAHFAKNYLSAHQITRFDDYFNNIIYALDIKATLEGSSNLARYNGTTESADDEIRNFEFYQANPILNRLLAHTDDQSQTNPSYAEIKRALGNMDQNTDFDNFFSPNGSIPGIGISDIDRSFLAQAAERHTPQRRSNASFGSSTT